MEKRSTVMSGAQFINGRTIKRSKLYRMVADDDFLFFKQKQLIEQFKLCEYGFQSISELRKIALNKHSRYEDYLFLVLKEKLKKLPRSHYALRFIDPTTYNLIVNQDII